MKGSISNYLTAKVAAVVVGVDGVGRGGTAEAYKNKRKLIFKKTKHKVSEIGQILPGRKIAMRSSLSTRKFSL